MKDDHPERQFAPIEPIESSGEAAMRSTSAPLHLLQLPPLEGHLPYGGLVHFRQSQEVHEEHLVHARRVATLNESLLRRFLAAHTTYYTRAAVDPATIPLAIDDPRLLWQAIDDARDIPSLSARRTAVARALEIAVQAAARHHGIAAPSAAYALAWLELLTTRKVIPPATRKLVRQLGKAQKILADLYKVIPAALSEREPELHNLIQSLEIAGTLLQQRDPLQLTAQHLRDAGLANLLRA